MVNYINENYSIFWATSANEVLGFFLLSILYIKMGPENNNKKL